VAELAHRAGRGGVLFRGLWAEGNYLIIDQSGVTNSSEVIIMQKRVCSNVEILERLVLKFDVRLPVDVARAPSKRVKVQLVQAIDGDVGHGGYAIGAKMNGGSIGVISVNQRERAIASGGR
jgi:hypothetical protein